MATVEQPLPTTVPVLGIVARHSNSGKTTLIERMIPLLAARSIRVAVIKHVHHEFDMDTPGKDSYRFRAAGANQVLAGSGQRAFLTMEFRPPREYPDLHQLIAVIDQTAVELILVEGFRRIPFPRIEATLAASAADLLCLEDSSIVAVAAKQPFDGVPVRQLPLDGPAEVVEFVLEWMATTNP